MNYKSNLVIPGFPKCGTSSLHEYLDMHPDIEMSRPKEPHFFSNEKKYIGGAKDHNDLFNDRQGAKFYGESSTTYCISELSCKRIYENLNNPKIIIILRDPVSRTLSHYKWLCALGLEDRSLAEALECDGYGFNFTKSWSGNFKSYYQFSQYHRYVPMWQEKFGEDSVLLLNSDNLRKDPKETLDKVWSFLGLTPVSLEASIIENSTESAKRIQMPGWLHKISQLMPSKLRRAIKRSEPLASFIRTVLGREMESYKPNYDDSDKVLMESQLQQDILFFEQLFKP